MRLNTAIALLAIIFTVQGLDIHVARAQWVGPPAHVPDDIPPGQGLASKPKFKHDYYRFSFGAGTSLALTDAPVAYNWEAAWQHDNQVLAANAVDCETNSPSPQQHTWAEFDLLYGYAINGYDLHMFGFQPERIYTSFSTGIGYFNYSTRFRHRRGFQQFDTTTYPLNSSIGGFGIPVQIQAIYSPFTFAGFGVTVFANLNTKLLNYGALFSVEVQPF